MAVSWSTLTGTSACPESGGLDHIVLNVADVERSLHFYQTTLGLAAERVEAWRRHEVGFPNAFIAVENI